MVARDQLTAGHASIGLYFRGHSSDNPLPPFTDDDGSRLNFAAYLDRHYSLAQIGLVTRIYGHGRRPSSTALSTETERVWRNYSLRGVFDGQLQRDPYEIMLALNYARGSLARGDGALAQRDYSTAAVAYSDVLTLFASDQAAQGLQRSQQAHLTANTP